MKPGKRKWPGYSFAAIMLVAGARALATGSLGRNLTHMAGPHMRLAGGIMVVIGIWAIFHTRDAANGKKPNQ